MMTAGLMTLLVLGIALSALWGAKYDPERNSFMSVEDSTFLRGLWCIIVVLVHIPKAYQNRIQDMLGSFAYIGVTFFFLTSAYGLKYSLIHKKAYMNHFWRRRLPGILIPALVANAVGVLINAAGGEPIAAFSFLHINSWVKVLLLYYLIFWLVYHILPRFTGAGRWQDVAMCAIVIVISLVDRLTPFKITSIWIVEPLGFAYGIIAAAAIALHNIIILIY
jgi:membrane-bound acyltransferase YfiQ involved in biofilm formation